MPEITFDHFYRYDELTQLLKAFAEEYPQLIQVESIGKSYEGRDIWLATVTNSETGPADEKPALWVDGNIHATEVSPTSACMYLVNRLTTQYGKDDEVTRSLDTRAYYICPRVNPDGAEWALADKPKIIRSSTRPYPFDEEPLPGFEGEDVDGDGRMVQMRISDPNGQWKAHPDEARLMVRRDATETGGQYYRIIPEGTIEDFDGVTITAKRVPQGLDLNRNFPMSWRQEHEQNGAGLYPTSEPEVHTIVDFIARHRNICGGIAFHTWSGVLLRPYGSMADEKMPAEDLWTFQKIGEKGTEITGYPNVSVYHDFRYHPAEVITGDFDEWAYDHMGIFSWTVEIWSPQRQAGIEEYKFIDWFREHPFEDDMKMLKWSDDVLDRKGYVDWYEFEHPQLGKVELGGWNMQYAWRNPPPQFLEKEIAPFSDWLIWQSLTSPRLELFDVQTTALGEDNYHIRVVVNNSGWLPSYVTKKAMEKKMRGVICEVELPEGATLKTGKAREDIGQLEGRAYTPSAISVWGSDANTSDRAKVEWVVNAPNGGEVKITARHDRAGTVRTTVNLSK
jgi:murein tripeptide amidase MpaA